MTIEYTYPPQYARFESDRGNYVPQSGTPGLFGADGFSFKDVLDTVNPLQQLPVVGALYREASGDSISAFARMAGGALLGGPLGFIIAAASAGLEAATGADPAQHLMALFDGETSTEYAASQYQKAFKLG